MTLAKAALWRLGSARHLVPLARHFLQLDPVAAHEASLRELKKASRRASEEMEEVVEEAEEEGKARLPVSPPVVAAAAAAAAAEATRQGGRTEAG